MKHIWYRKRYPDHLPKFECFLKWYPNQLLYFQHWQTVNSHRERQLISYQSLEHFSYFFYEFNCFHMKNPHFQSLTYRKMISVSFKKTSALTENDSSFLASPLSTSSEREMRLPRRSVEEKMEACMIINILSFNLLFYYSSQFNLIFALENLLFI